MMKMKTLLLALTLALTTAIGWAQTVTYTIDGAITTDADATKLSTGDLANATAITLKGNWVTANFTTLKTAIKTDKDPATANAVLKTADLSAIMMTGKEIKLDSLFLNCTALTTVTTPNSECPSTAYFRGTFKNCTALTGTIDLYKFTGIFS